MAEIIGRYPDGMIKSLPTAARIRARISVIKYMGSPHLSERWFDHLLLIAEQGRRGRRVSRCRQRRLSGKAPRILRTGQPLFRSASS